MNILYITQFYPPETGAASVRANEFINNWAKCGHHVAALTGFPNYPKGEFYPGYKNSICDIEENNNIKIIRTFTYIPKYRSITLRIVNQITFNVFSIIGGLRASKPDVVIASSPPFGIGLVGYLLSRFWRAKFIFEVRDLFPESAIAFGVLNNRLLIRCLKVIEKFYYKKADLIVGATQGICDFIAGIGIPQSKIRKITNGVNVDFFKKISSTNFRKDHKLEDYFIVMYTGIHGRAENLSTLIEAAKLTKYKKSIRYVLIGDGVEKKKLMKLSENYRLNNILFIESQPMKCMPQILASADLCFSSRKDLSISTGALPVKIFEYMACEKPVVISIKGEAEKLVRAAGAGICVDPDDAESLAMAISNLEKDESLRNKFRKNSRAFVEKYYNRQNISAHYLDLLKETTTYLSDDGL